MFERFRTAWAKGLKVMFELFGAVGCLGLAFVAALVAVTLATAFGLVFSAFVMVLVVVLWPLSFAWYMAPDAQDSADETEFGATYDALHAEDRRLHDIHARARIHEAYSPWSRGALETRYGKPRPNTEL